MIDVHAPDVLATLNRRARSDRAALQRDLLALAKHRPADFAVLIGEVLAPAVDEAIREMTPAAPRACAKRKGGTR